MRLVFCDNGSTDNSWKIIQSFAEQDSRVLGIRMPRTFGLDSAFTCGLDLANADAAIIMASDLQDPPEVIHQFLDKYEEGYEQVVAEITKRGSVPFVRRVLSKTFCNLANHLTKDMIPKGVSDFRLLSRPAYLAARSLRERNRFLRSLIAWTGFKTAEIEIERPERYGGDSKFVSIKLSKVLQWAFGAIFAHTTAPLVWVSVMGVFFSVVSVVATAVLSIFWIFKGVPFAGFGTIVGFVSIGFSLVLLSIGVIAQYIPLIYEEVDRSTSLHRGQMSPFQITRLLKLKNWPVSLRFLLFGALNYIAGNLIFTAYWWLWGKKFPYLLIAVLATITASLVSYSTHTFGILQSRWFNSKNLTYYSVLQGLGLAISSLLVQKVSHLFQIHLLYAQYVWYARFSATGIVILKMLTGRFNGD